MDFDHAIKAHSDWKRKLSLYIRQPDKSIKADEVAQDNKCDLGKWILQSASQFSNNQDYKALKEAHTRFHKAAAEVVRKADAGQAVSEEIQLGGASEFSKASTAVVSAIMAMKKKAA